MVDETQYFVRKEKKMLNCVNCKDRYATERKYIKLQNIAKQSCRSMVHEYKLLLKLIKKKKTYNY